MSGDFSTYSKYRAVELGWLNEIPDHWALKKVKYLGKVIIGLTYSPNDIASPDEGTLVLRSSNIQNGQLSLRDNVYVSKAIPEKLRTKVGDILICVRNGSRALIGKNIVIDDKSSGVTFGAFMSIYRSDYNRYVAKVFNSALFEYQSGSYLTSTINQLTTGNLNGFEIPLPSALEQQNIANFLDHETAKIDTLIEKQQQLIKLLKEKRQAVISHAVTKGLSPDAPLKDSGVEWLGEVPAGWVLSRVKDVTHSIADGPHFSPNYVDEGKLFLSARNVKVDRWSFADVKYISDEDFEEFNKRVRPAVGDVLLTKGGTTGIARAVDLTFPFQVWVHIAVLKPKFEKVQPEYLAFALNGKACYEQSQLYTRGATNNDLGLTRIVNICFPLPPLPMQAEIVMYLNEVNQKFGNLITLVENQLALLQERRTALISAAVTGKIDVRNWQAPEFTSTPRMDA